MALERVHDQIEDDLLHLHSIGDDGRQVGLRRMAHGDAQGLRLGTNEPEHVVDDDCHIDTLAQHFPSSQEGPDARDHLAGAGCRRG